MNRLIFISFIMLLSSFAVGQNENRLIRKGNSEYEEGNYKKAEVWYLKSRESKDPSYKGIFNLGDAWYQQENYLQAASAFDSLRNFDLDDDIRSGTDYNLGNSLLQLALDTTMQEQNQQALPGSIESYKNALRLNPGDQDAKYNLAYAQNLLQQQQDQQDQQQDQQDQENKQDDQQQQDQQEQNDQDQPQDEQEQPQDRQQQKQQPQQISKEDAERILEALKNDEKETMEKLQKEKVKSTAVGKSEIDW